MYILVFASQSSFKKKKKNLVLSISVTASLNWCTIPRDMPNMCQKCVTLQKSILWNGQGW